MDDTDVSGRKAAAGQADTDHVTPRPDPLLLVAEDDADIRSLVCERLEREGFRVVTAGSGSAAVALAATERPDVLLLDVGLPDGDGYEVCRRVLASSDAPPAIIFLTARDAVADRITGLDAGAVDYVAKPFHAAELSARVHAALRTKRRADGLAELATTDTLTGLLNRATLQRRLREQHALASRGGSLACVIADIDHFKQMNDTHGHAGGDTVLREVSRRVGAGVRASDLVFRYGGEEFLVLLPATCLEGARAVGQNILAAVRSAPVALADGTRVSLSISVGVAPWRDSMASGEELVAAADAALYEAKRLGRGRISIAA